jgi:hypothetical protein
MIEATQQFVPPGVGVKRFEGEIVHADFHVLVECKHHDWKNSRDSDLTISLLTYAGIGSRIGFV